MDKERIRYLFRKYVDKTASLTERDELMQYIQTTSEDEIASLLEESYQLPEVDEEIFSAVQRTKMLRAILPGHDQEHFAKKPKKKLLSRSIIVKFSAVAALLLITLTIGFLFYRDHAKTVDLEIAQQVDLTDILPGQDKTTLTLADGTIISLNEIKEGKVAEQHGVRVAKTEDGQLRYYIEPSDDDFQNIDAVEAAYHHTITTPRGGQYQVLLPDGTKVWLNASSSLKYPPLFSRTERRVELTGEGYFEVASNKLLPFIVETENQSVKVLGTHFNINTYKDTKGTKTTLLEGSVAIDYVSSTEKRASRILQPGEQAVLNGQRTLAVKKVDLSNAIAWKNGLFYFENTPVEQVLAEFSRWYNFDFEFEGEVPAINLWGSVYRNVNASEALEILHYFNLKYRVIKDVNKRGGWKIVVSNL